MRVTLRLAGEGLEPDEVSAALGTRPTAARRGEGGGSHGDPAPSVGRWYLSLEGSDRPDAMIRRLLSSMTGEPAAWRRLGARYQVDLFCAVFLEERTRVAALSAETLKGLADRGLSLRLDLNWVGEGPG